MKGHVVSVLMVIIQQLRPSQWPRGLRRGSAAVCLLGLRVRIHPGAWLCVSLLSVVCCQVEVSASG
jgi:hypothetical protein